MKIAMLSDFYPPIIGGMERHVQSLSQELAKRGHEVAVCTIGHPDLPKYEDKEGIKVYRLQGFFQKIPFLFKDLAKRYQPPTQDRLIARQLRRIFGEEKPDVIHAHGWILYSALPLKRDFNIPLLATLHDYGFLCPKRSLLSNKNALCDGPFTRKCISCGREQYGFIKSLATYYGVKTNKDKLRSADKFIAVSSFMKQVYAKHLGLSDDDIATIPNFYAPDVNEQQEEAIELPQDFVLFVGVLAPFKGVNLLIEACQKLNGQTKLILIGGTHPGYHYESAENILIIENAPHDVVMQAMSRCRFAAFPSIWPDPCPTVALEAMSQKKAVIASDTGGLRDIVADQQTGILVPANDRDKLAEAISYLLQSPEMASEMGNRGYDRLAKNYMLDAVMTKTIALYESLI